MTGGAESPCLRDDTSRPARNASSAAACPHRWAIGLRDAIGRAGGFVLADEWIHPKDLIAVGFKAAEGAKA